MERGGRGRSRVAGGEKGRVSLAAERAGPKALLWGSCTGVPGHPCTGGAKEGLIIWSGRRKDPALTLARIVFCMQDGWGGWGLQCNVCRGSQPGEGSRRGLIRCRVDPDSLQKRSMDPGLVPVGQRRINRTHHRIPSAVKSQVMHGE